MLRLLSQGTLKLMKRIALRHPQLIHNSHVQQFLFFNAYVGRTDVHQLMPIHILECGKTFQYLGVI